MIEILKSFPVFNHETKTLISRLRRSIDVDCWQLDCEAEYQAGSYRRFEIKYLSIFCKNHEKGRKKTEELTVPLRNTRHKIKYF